MFLFQFVPIADMVPSPLLTQPIQICLPCGHHFFRGHLLIGPPCHWLYGTRKWSEWAFNCLIVNAGCQKAKDTIGFDYRVTAAEKMCICDFCQWEHFINYSMFSQMYHFAVKWLDYIRSSLSLRGSGFFIFFLVCYFFSPPFPFCFSLIRVEESNTASFGQTRQVCSSLADEWCQTDIFIFI